MSRPQSIHAVYYVLNDCEFFGASLQSIYDHVSGVTVVSCYDRDRFGKPRLPDGMADLVLSRAVDPDRKVNLIVTTEGSEPTGRNRGTAFAAAPPRVVNLAGQPAGIPAPDLFWYIDADEVYDEDEIGRLLRWVGDHPARVYLLELRTYFRTWNWRVTERGSFVALSRPGFRFGALRNWYPTVWSRGWARLARDGRVSEQVALRAVRARLVPASVAVCHHGSYVGPRARIEQKLASSAHHDQVVDGWFDEVWDRWTPETRDFHPTEGARFPVAVHVETEHLPKAIREHDWPSGWIERPEMSTPRPPTMRSAAVERSAG